MAFLSQLLNRRVVDNRGRAVGKLRDVIVSLDVPTPFPPVGAILVQSAARGRGAVAVPWRQVGSVDANPLRLACPIDDIEPYQRSAGDIALAKDILDKQIVDLDGAKMVRVNDLELTAANGELRLAAVDNTLAGLLRRLGAGALAEAPLANRVLVRDLISWEDVDVLPQSIPQVKLKTPLRNLSRLHPADIAEIVSQLSVRQRTDAIGAMEDETAARAMAEVEPEMQVDIMERLDAGRAADILEEMEPDDAADLLRDLDYRFAQELLALMEPDAADDARELMAYPDDSAGGLMTTDYVGFGAKVTAQAAIDRLRELRPEAEVAHYIYITDAEEHLLGVLSLRDLVISPPETPLGDIVRRDVVTVSPSTHPEEVATLLEKYNLVALPVVDAENRLQGVINIDDVIELVLPRSWRRKSSRMGD